MNSAHTNPLVDVVHRVPHVRRGGGVGDRVAVLEFQEVVDRGVGRGDAGGGVVGGDVAVLVVLDGHGGKGRWVVVCGRVGCGRVGGLWQGVTRYVHFTYWADGTCFLSDFVKRYSSGTLSWIRLNFSLPRLLMCFSVHVLYAAIWAAQWEVWILGSVGWSAAAVSRQVKRAVVGFEQAGMARGKVEVRWVVGSLEGAVPIAEGGLDEGELCWGELYQAVQGKQHRAYRASNNSARSILQAEQRTT